MTIALLDTNVVSYLFKGDTRATAYAAILQGHRLAISFMSVAELFEWAMTRKWGHVRLARLEQTLATYVIIPVDVELCRLWGMLRAQHKTLVERLRPKMPGLLPPRCGTSFPWSHIIRAISSTSLASMFARSQSRKVFWPTPLIWLLGGWVWLAPRAAGSSQPQPAGRQAGR
jgi:tRNA(fMet)-specific endonuclease VapC